MDALLKPLMQSPRLRRHIDTLQKAWDDEQIARRRFRDWVTPGKKAEFINGEIVVHSPARYRHTDARTLIERLLSLYADRRGFGKVLGEKMMVECDRNDYEPDVCFWPSEQADAFDAEQMIFPPPALAVEVLSPTTERTDRGVKFDDYAADGVREYWIVDTETRMVEQYKLNGARFEVSADIGGEEVIRSVAVPGFESPVSSFFDTAKNMQACARLFA